jgi:hypothetical protein
MSGDQLENRFAHVRELDEFEAESKARKIIAELFKPVLEDMDHDRKQSALIDLRMT